MATRVSFPAGFVWGAATSSYQIEGATNEDGRGESIWDRYAKTVANIKDGSNGDVACDHYHRWRQDVALMGSLKLAAYRFSVAWPRVHPTGRSPVNDRGLDFYSRLVDALLERGIAPYVTLYHWDLPQVLQDAGGWVNRDTAHAFVEYAEAVSRRLGDRVKHWITHNEPWCASFVSYAKGVHAPGLRDWSAAIASSHHLLLSHGWAVSVIRRNSPGAEVGITVNLSPAVPASPSPDDADAARHYDGFMNRWFLDPLYRGFYPPDMVLDYVRAGYLAETGMPFVRSGDLRDIAVATDFLGVNYYNRAVTRSDRVPEQKNRPRTVFLAPPSEWTAIGWEVYPQGMFEVLMRVHLGYRPAKIYVTENGASYPDAPDASKRVADTRRIAFMRDHLLAARRAIGEGVPLEGYFAWSLMDNYEWDHGYTQRFGLTWIDYATQERIPKDSAFWYREVIAQNAVEAAQ
ncbi:MAG: GH1 family beta-glucosidase [Polyangiaceae bacterium]|jgi:beta-glucosidase